MAISRTAPFAVQAWRSFCAAMAVVVGEFVCVDHKIVYKIKRFVLGFKTKNHYAVEILHYFSAPNQISKLNHIYAC